MTMPTATVLVALLHMYLRERARFEDMPAARVGTTALALSSVSACRERRPDL